MRLVSMRSTRTVGLAIVGLLCAGALTGALTGAPSATAAPKLRLTTVAKADTPIGFALHPSGTLYVVEQGGSFRSFAVTKWV